MRVIIKDSCLIVTADELSCVFYGTRRHDGFHLSAGSGAELSSGKALSTEQRKEMLSKIMEYADNTFISLIFEE